MNGTVTVPLRHCTTTTCKVVGAQQFRLILVANASNGIGADGAREIIFRYATDKMSSWGKPPPSFALSTFTVECAESNGPKCYFDPDHMWYWRSTFGELRSTPLISPTYRFTGVATTGTGKDKKNFYPFYPMLRWQSHESTRGPDVLSRCDQASYLQKGGCVFMGTDPVLSYSKSNPAWSQFTQHLSDALSGDITETKPGTPGKEIPGSRESGKSLTRLYQGYAPQHYNRNNAIAISNCKKFWGKDYATSAEYPRDCDEYPFRSTFEGAAYNELPDIETKWTYSSRPIKRTHNQAAGRALRSFYLKQHVIHGDNFWVELTP